MRNIEEFKDIHKDERCVIIGTGPSLLDTNFDLIKGEILFGCNSVFNGYEEFGISCRYYGVGDGLTLSRPHVRGLLDLDTILFISEDAYNYCFDNPKKLAWRKQKYPIVDKRDMMDFEDVSKLKLPYNSVVLDHLKGNPSMHVGSFSKDLSEGHGLGGTVVFDICLHIAYHMGFSEVYLIGVDCDYSPPFHFDGSPPDRFINGKMFDSTLPFFAYSQAKEAFESDGREIVNCTPNGKLEIFKRKSLEEVFGTWQMNLPLEL